MFFHFFLFICFAFYFLKSPHSSSVSWLLYYSRGFYSFGRRDEQSSSTIQDKRDDQSLFLLCLIFTWSCFLSCLNILLISLYLYLHPKFLHGIKAIKEQMFIDCWSPSLKQQLLITVQLLPSLFKLLLHQNDMLGFSPN